MCPAAVAELITGHLLFLLFFTLAMAPSLCNFPGSRLTGMILYSIKAKDNRMKNYGFFAAVNIAEAKGTRSEIYQILTSKSWWALEGQKASLERVPS